MAEYRSNHFVPKAYLKRWTLPIPWKNSGQMIWMKQKDNGIARAIPADKQCQKDNLYTVPDNIAFEDKKTLEKHWFGHVDDYYPRSMNNSLDVGELPSTPADLGGILWFVVYQTFRTPKYKRETERKRIELEAVNPQLSELRLDYAAHLAYLMVETFIPFHEEVVPEFLVAPIGTWFITSDNPASYWLSTWNQKNYVPTLLGTNWKTRNLEILCPLTPQWCLLLKLNQVKKEKDFLGFKRNCYPDEVKRINKSIVEAADKVLYSFDRETLDNI